MLYKDKAQNVLFAFLFLHLQLLSQVKAPALCLIFMILVSLENVKKYSHVVARLPQRLKSTLFEIFSTLRVPFWHPPFEKISNKNETKIVKITHSVQYTTVMTHISICGSSVDICIRWAQTRRPPLLVSHNWPSVNTVTAGPGSRSSTGGTGHPWAPRFDIATCLPAEAP